MDSLAATVVPTASSGQTAQVPKGKRGAGYRSKIIVKPSSGTAISTCSSNTTAPPVGPTVPFLSVCYAVGADIKMSPSYFSPPLPQPNNTGTERNRLNLKLVTSSRIAKKWISRPNFQRFEIINDNLTTIFLSPAKVYQNKPIYAGFCILDLSKEIMFSFHYDVIVNYYNENVKLLYTDTDSLLYSITTDDVYDDMLQNIKAFDTSDYPKIHKCYSATICKLLGKFQDECSAIPPLEFVGLRSKMMYSLLFGEDKKTR